MRTHPYTLTEVQALQTEALARQSPEALVAAGADLGALAAAAALANERAGRTLAVTGVEAIASPDAKASLETALDRADQLFGRLHLTPPTAEQLAGSGVDLGALGQRHERMTREGQEPRWVLAPRLPASRWQELYQHLEQDRTVNVGGRIKQGGLSIDGKVANEWDRLGDLPAGVPVIRHQDAGGSCSWTLRLIPGTSRPTETNVSHDDPRYPDKPTVHEYLAAQATLLQASEDPLDDTSWTWLHGTVQHGSQAPSGNWYPGYGLVYLDRYNVGRRIDSLGVRPPVCFGLWPGLGGFGFGGRPT